MKIKKKCVAMLLAGGQGSRLYALTQKVAENIVSLTSRYRTAPIPVWIPLVY